MRNIAPRPRQMELLSFRPIRKNSLRGFCSVQLPNGLLIHDIPVLCSHGKYWATLPSKPMIDSAGIVLRDDAGKIRYGVVNEWPTPDLQHEFSKRVVTLIRAQYPNALEGGS